MKFTTAAIVGGWAVGAVYATPVENIFGRAVGDRCKGTHGSGTCQSTSNCKGISYTQAFCPNDPDDVQCCVEIPCQANGGSGFCRSVSNNGCAGGSFHAGQGPNWPCPGDNDIQCCIKGGGSTPTPPETTCSVDGGSGVCRSVSKDGCPGGSFHAGQGPNWPCPGDNDVQCCIKGGSTPPPPSGGDVGQKILAKAMTAAGTPYAWGGGSCSGPTRNIDPGEHPSEIGFDCSGLVAWAVCQVTGRNLFAEGLRVTSSMYCASEAKLKYKKIPYAQRRAGDAVFFGGACKCSDVHHVGLMMDSGDRMWNSPNDQINRVQENSISGFGEKPCPYVIRFS